MTLMVLFLEFGFLIDLGVMLKYELHISIKEVLYSKKSYM
jgi:hypothetical protein